MMGDKTNSLSQGNICLYHQILAFHNSSANIALPPLATEAGLGAQKRSYFL